MSRAGDSGLEDALDEQLRRRLERTLASAAALLAGEPRDGGERVDAAALRTAIDALVTALGDAGDDAAEASRRAHEQQLARMRSRFEARVAALDRVHAQIAGLRKVTSPAAMLERAATALSDGADLDRVVLSTVHDGVMTVRAVHVRDDPAAAAALLDALRERPLRLEHPLVESELLRRRRATVVTDAQVHPRVDRQMAAALGWDSYVAAPVTVRGQPIALIHADRGPARPLDVLQRDLLWEFASGLAQAYESASLRRTLRHERDQLRHFLAWLDARSGELTDAPVELVPRAPAVLPPEPLDDVAGRASRAGDGALTGLLTPRELEVLRLLADGRTNRAIADELVISGSTVKYHVNSILRKLRAANRAEAVARYYALRRRREDGRSDSGA